MKLKFLQKIIDVLRGKRKTKFNFWVEGLKRQKQYNKIIKNIKRKAQNGEKIKVCFSVVFDSVFPAEVIFKKMLIDELFEPSILVIPDVSRGIDNQFSQLKKTYQSYLSKYGNAHVFSAYDENNDSFVDYVSKYDLAFFANPYDKMTSDLYSIDYYQSNGVLPIYVSYGTMPDYYARNHIINLKSLNMCWKVFVDTQENFEDVVKYTDTKGFNAVLSGYCKMDALNLVKNQELKRKKIIIAPHHTVNMPDFPLSKFIEYADFFIELPVKYPQVDFVFRPHPLLFVTLSNESLWGKDKVNQYLRKISSFPNVEYQDGGDYFETFVNSSAIIHDCSSFIMEYLYTGHPACYMLKDKNEVKEIFAPIGQKCLANYYQAFNKEDIIKFIEDVVINGNDPIKDERINFAKNEIMINYPNVTDWIINYIKEELI